MNRADEVGTSDELPVYWIVTLFDARLISGGGGRLTMNVLDAVPAGWFAVAAWVTVIVVVPAPTGVTCPDEFTVATLVTLLEYDKTPALTVVIKLDKEKEASVVSLFGISAKEITLGMKLATLGVEIVVRTFPLPSLPYFATIEGVKLVPIGWELNALRIFASVIGTLLFPSWTDVIACVCVTWFCEVPVVTLSVRERNEEEKGTGVCAIYFIYLLNIIKNN
jgi:hypothetical protein